MSEEEKEVKGLVVKDRRRFDSSGNEKNEADVSPSPRPVVEAVQPPPAPPKAAVPEEPSAPKEKLEMPKTEAVESQKAYDKSNSGQNDHEEMNFSSFVMSLATQALMQLGEIKPPPGMNLEIDTVAARQSIDILGMLQTKTRNNLDQEEAHLLEQIVHNLRLSYVKAVS